MAPVDPIELLRQHVAKNGLKNSRQRELIAEIFFSLGGHVRIEDLIERVRRSDAKVSQATVYRTMKLLGECGLAQTRHFAEGQTVYEPSDMLAGAHHDHLICLDCGKIVEFVDDRIERLQDELALKHGFALEKHRLELYGRCKDPSCSGKPESKTEG